MVHADQSISRFRTHKAAALLAWLALQPGKAFSRDLLIDLLWPEKPQEAGRANLSNALTSLRRQFERTRGLAGNVFLTDHQTIRLNPRIVSSDVHEFESLLQGAARTACVSEQREFLEQAILCYQEEFLTGFFEAWVLAEQQRLRTLYIQATTQLYLLIEQSGDLETALEMTTRLLEADPLEETVYQNRMRLYLALGQPHAALTAYEQLTNLLASELDALPLAPTQELAEQARRFQPQHAGAPVLSVLPPLPVLSPPAPPSFPTALSPPNFPAPSLPLQLTRFFGREVEMTALQRLLTRTTARLVTLLGPGGVGKTRLAIEAARSLAADFKGRIVFVSLADVREPTHLPLALAGALKIAPTAADALFEAALQVLSAGPYLLLLDNLEQLLVDIPSDGADPLAGKCATREFVRTLLARAPHVTCLLTSRQPLGLAGEQEYLVTALHTPEESLPQREEALDATDLHTYASVALYEDRVRLVKPDFVITPTNAHAVVALCQRLEGMPLAIEMAAAWGRTLSPRRTLERLMQRLDLQVSRRSDLPTRHQSLRATIEWSYDLLSPSLQSLFTALSVFRGGWTLEAFEGVGGADIPMLMELVERSLAVLEENKAGEVRYRLLETLHEFAVEKREERGETEALRARHAAYFLQMAEEIAFSVRNGKHTTELMLLETEHDNLRAALTWCLSGLGDVQMGLRLCGALAYFWEMHGHLQEGYAWCVTALKAEGAQERTLARAIALSGAGRLAEFQQDRTLERPYFEECLSIATEREDPYYRAMALNNLALISHSAGDYSQARSLYTEVLAANRSMGNWASVAKNLNNLGLLSSAEGDYESARRLFTECLALNRKVGNRVSEAGNLNNLGLVFFWLTDYRSAIPLYEEALALNRELGNRLWEATNLKNLGDARFEIGEAEAALTLYEQALTLNHEMDYRARAASNLTSMGRVRHSLGDYVAARSCFRKSLSLSRETDDMLELIAVLESIAFLLAAETGLVPVWTPPQPPDQEKTVPGSQSIAPSLPAPPEAMASLRHVARLWGAVQSLREQFPLQEEEERPPHYDNRAAVCARLGESVMEAGLTEGRAFSLEQAVAYTHSRLNAS